MIFWHLGEAPFGDTDKLSKFEIFNNINGRAVSLPMGMSADLKALIKGLLEKDQRERFDFGAICCNPWVLHVDWSGISNLTVTPPWIPHNCSAPGKP
jgi:hypothetical protein